MGESLALFQKFRHREFCYLVGVVACAFHQNLKGVLTENRTGMCDLSRGARHVKAGSVNKERFVACVGDFDETTAMGHLFVGN